MFVKEKSFSFYSLFLRAVNDHVQSLTLDLKLHMLDYFNENKINSTFYDTNLLNIATKQTDENKISLLRNSFAMYTQQK